MVPLPGAVGVTDLRVYDWPAPDGIVGGGPHMHLCCTEAYCVIEGRGLVQTLAADGVLREMALEREKIVWFTPGVIHRLVNLDGNLRILVIMQNAGLPEAGDFVLTFPKSLLRDATEYERHASIAPSGHVYASSLEAARRRRDLAVEGFLELQSDVKQGGTEAMRDFYELGRKLIEPKLTRWRETWKAGPLAATNETQDQLDQLEQGRIEHLLRGSVFSLMPPAADRKLGMCGTLGIYLPEGISS
jgi:mannose-6-phosphate isomerase-like protein (cupin superfamily)